MSTNGLESTVSVWRPVEALTYLDAPGGGEYACLLLNRPIDGREVEVLRVWNRASFRVSVDGGTNVLRKLIEDQDKHALEAAKLPDFITGDFDSITDKIVPTEAATNAHETIWGSLLNEIFNPSETVGSPPSKRIIAQPTSAVLKKTTTKYSTK